MAVPLPTSIDLAFSSVISCERTMCGVSMKTISLSFFSLCSLAKKYLKNGIGIQVDQLNPVEIKKTTKEGGGWQ